MANIHQKAKNGTWYISYRQDGQLKHHSLRTKNARKARTLKKEIDLLLESSATPEVSVSAQPPRETKNVSIDEFWDDFMKWAREHRSERTIEEYANWSGQFREYSGIQRPCDVTMEQVEGFKSRLRAQGKGKPTGVGLDDASINNALKTLRYIWNHAQKLGYYAGENPFARVEPYRIAQRPPRDYLGQNQISAPMTAA